jgi:hypothetical protein
MRYGGSTCSIGGVNRISNLIIYGGTANLSSVDSSYSGHNGIRISASGTVSIAYSQIHDNPVGIDVESGNVTVGSSTFFTNSGYGAFQVGAPTSTMANNYWGGWYPRDRSTSTIYNSGPYNALTNSLGAGNQVSSYIGYNSYIEAYLLGPDYPSAVNMGSSTYKIRIGSSTAYQSQLDLGIQTWNTSTADSVILSDVSSSPSSNWDTG